MILVSKEVETAFIICWHESQEEYGLSFLSAVRLHHLLARISREYGLYFLLYGALNAAQISRGVRTVCSCCTVHLFLAQISRKVQLSLLLYGLPLNCTEIEKSVRPVYCCIDCIYWHDFQGYVRPGTAVQLHLVWHRNREKCTAGFAEHISRLCEKVCRWR